MEINLKVKKAKPVGKSITITISEDMYKAIEKSAKRNKVSKNKICIIKLKRAYVF